MKHSTITAKGFQHLPDNALGAWYVWWVDRKTQHQAYFGNEQAARTLYETLETVDEERQRLMYRGM